MAHQDTPQEPASPRQAFTFYAADGRVHASNVAQKLIDLGSLQQQADGWCYLLDGNKHTGERLPSAEAALRHIVDHVRFLYLDGQFTALADMRGNAGVHLDGAPRIDVMIDELQSREPIEDTTA
jgi:hypothetical protein